MNTIIPDKFGSEMVIETCDSKTGTRGILVIDNAALCPGKGGIKILQEKAD